MLQPERYDGLAFVSVPSSQTAEAISRLKHTLSDDDRECPTCTYTGPESRWGLQTYDTTDPDRVAIVLCCPACETKVDLDPELDDGH